ncbi:MAG: hypothetical protein IIB44_06150 [Candidatus Marinimicrobia bacterium]|nr:hypothetical protein [Candidatus Neomarinimicrobiota bacterium]
MIYWLLVNGNWLLVSACPASSVARNERTGVEGGTIVQVLAVNGGVSLFNDAQTNIWSAYLPA